MASLVYEIILSKIRSTNGSTWFNTIKTEEKTAHNEIDDIENLQRISFIKSFRMISQKYHFANEYAFERIGCCKYYIQQC